MMTYNGYGVWEVENRGVTIEYFTEIDLKEEKSEVSESYWQYVTGRQRRAGSVTRRVPRSSRPATVMNDLLGPAQVRMQDALSIPLSSPPTVPAYSLTAFENAVMNHLYGRVRESNITDLPDELGVFRRMSGYLIVRGEGVNEMAVRYVALSGDMFIVSGPHGGYPYRFGTVESAVNQLNLTHEDTRDNLPGVGGVAAAGQSSGH